MNLGAITLNWCIFKAPLGTGYTVQQLKALRYGKDDSRGQNCGSTLKIYQGVLKSGNLLYKRGSADSQFGPSAGAYVK